MQGEEMFDKCECGHARGEHDRPVGDADDNDAFCAICNCEHFTHDHDNPTMPDDYRPRDDAWTS